MVRTGPEPAPPRAVRRALPLRERARSASRRLRSRLHGPPCELCQAACPPHADVRGARLRPQGLRGFPARAASRDRYRRSRRRPVRPPRGPARRASSATATAVTSRSCSPSAIRSSSPPRSSSRRLHPGSTFGRSPDDAGDRPPWSAPTPGEAAERFLRRMVGDRRYERLPAATRVELLQDGPALVTELTTIRRDPAPFDPRPYRGAGHRRLGERVPRAAPAGLGVARRLGSRRYQARDRRRRAQRPPHAFEAGARSSS